MEPLNAADFFELLKSEVILIDTRSHSSFCDGFAVSAVSVPLGENFTERLRKVTDTEVPLAVFTDAQSRSEVVKALRGDGAVKLAGYYQEPIEDWKKHGYETDVLVAIDAEEFAMDYNYDEFYLIDVRTKEDFGESHAEDAQNIPLEDILTAVAELSEEGSYYIYGNTPEEAVSAASIFRRAGFVRVRAIAATYEELNKTKIPFFKKKKGAEQKPPFGTN